MICYLFNFFLGVGLVYFRKQEKVFSLARTEKSVPYDDLPSLWGEFFSYLVVAGCYLEGGDEQAFSPGYNMTPISDEYFSLPMGSYNEIIRMKISKGLRERFLALSIHRDTNEMERGLLMDLDGIFSLSSGTFYQLSAKRIIGVSLTRNLSPTDKIIAHYASVMYGQKDFAAPTSLPQIYLSKFGNIHLAQDEDCLALVSEPELKYAAPCGQTFVSPVWSLASSVIDSFIAKGYPGFHLCDMLSDLSFLTTDYTNTAGTSIPHICAVAELLTITEGSECTTTNLVADFYNSFLYGRTGDIHIHRQCIFKYIVNVMAKKMGESRLNLLFPYASRFYILLGSKALAGSDARRYDVLNFALEALDADLDAADSDANSALDSKEPTLDSDEPEEDPASDAEPKRDPATDDGGFDPAIPSPATPTAVAEPDMDTIELIPFDKTGEGVEEDLYRSSVVALNDRIQSDDSVPITAQVKEALKYWVNGFLYRSAISATKDQIKTLGLQKYLKNVD